MAEVAGTPLERLCAHRGVAVPPDGHLLSLAPVLGMRPADLLVIAGGAVPAEFVPADPEAAATVQSLMRNRLDVAAAEAMRDHARSLPRLSGPAVPVDLPALPDVTFSAVFRRLMELRCLTRRAAANATSSAESTIARAMGGAVLNPRALELLSALLNLRADDVEAMAGWTAQGPPVHPSVWEQKPILWATGELLLALAPLQHEQIKAVIGGSHDDLDVAELGRRGDSVDGDVGRAECRPQVVGVAAEPGCGLVGGLEEGAGRDGVVGSGGGDGADQEQRFV